MECPIPRWKSGLTKLTMGHGKKVHEYTDKGNRGSTMNRCGGHQTNPLHVGLSCRYLSNLSVREIEPP
jgi:hypothetical protein